MHGFDGRGRFHTAFDFKKSSDFRIIRVQKSQQRLRATGFGRRTGRWRRWMRAASLFAHEDDGADRKRALGGDPSGEKAEGKHGEDDAGENKRVANIGLIDDEGDDAACENPENQSRHRTKSQQLERAAESRLEHFLALSAQRDADAELALALAD